VFKTILAVLCFFAVPASAAWGQALPTASRAGDLQIGGGFGLAYPDYTFSKFTGFVGYGDFDFREHFGVEADFHYVSGASTDQIYEKTYEIGGRYVRHYGIINPYAKVMIGRGVFNFPLPAGAPSGSAHPNLAYNIMGLGAGADFNIRRTINVRGDIEYQDWFGFPPHGLNPTVITIGAAYHFNFLK